ncbi:MAG: hypothetical protein E4H14_19330 [Candidatus Thorarchaeota archaeon]|nr:MAG: hypothetical protein E4H14_19330 [Candidatus Thorarchaeota archaeon]
MTSNQTRLLTIVILAVLVSGGAMAALVFLQPETSPPVDPFVTIFGTGGTSQNVTFTEMLSMTAVTGNSSYQNSYGNVGGTGIYTGVKVSDLVDLVGGMSESYLLRVVASDDYSQTFEYAKVYPNATYLAIQGDMILAYEYNGSTVPNYESGFRLAFIPDDGYYSSADANATTDPNPVAAGPQWVANVAKLEILKNLYTETLELSESFLRTLPNVTGEGGYLKKDGITIVGPFNYTGVPFSVLLQQFSTIPDDYIIKSLSGDAYTNEYTKSVVEGELSGYTPTRDPLTSINSTMVLAYEENGTAIVDGGPLKIVFLNEDGNLTDGFRWAKDVVSLTILEVESSTPMLSSQLDFTVELLMITSRNQR